MSWTVLTTPLAFAATVVLTSVFFYLYFRNREKYLALWALGFASNALRYALEFIRPEPAPILLIGQLASLLNGLFFLWGTHAFVGKRVPGWWSFAVLLGATWIVVGVATQVSFFWLSLPTFVFSGLSLVWAGTTFLRWRGGAGIGRPLVGWTLTLWGLHKLDYPLLRPITWLAPWAYLFSAALETLVALGMLLASFEKTSGALASTNERLNRIFAASPSPMLMSRRKDWVCVDVNRSFLRAIGYERSDVVGRSVAALGLWVDGTNSRRILAEIEGRLPLRGLEGRFRTKTGEERVGSFSVELITLDGEDFLLSTVEDITERKRAAEVLQRYQVLSEEIRDIILFVRLDGQIVEANEAASRAYGYTREELLSLAIKDLRSPETEALSQALLDEAFAHGILFETVHKCRDGRVFPVEVSSRGLTMDGQRVLASIIRDVSERQKAEREIRYLSFHDKLTGLYNRAFLEVEAERLTAGRERPFSLVMGDVNGLKLVNDAFGHQKGDELLRRIAGILRESCRREDVVARWGGDEFAILLPQTSREVASAVCDRIGAACEDATLGPIPLSISLGVATADETEVELSHLLREAEDHMYRRKLLESRSTQSAIVSSLGKALWESSHETEEHAERLRQMAAQFGAALNLPPGQLDELSLLAALHDIGKVGIPNTILEKPGPLTPGEWETMKKHPEIGYRIAQAAPNLAGMAEAILAHHERWDGTGYPQGLRGENIPLVARILAIVDSFDVMTHPRPYKNAQSVEYALGELARCAGTQFDPDLVRVFLEIFGAPADSAGAVS